MKIIDYFASDNKGYWLSEIQKSDWAFPEYRGKRRVGKLLEYAYMLAKNEGHKHIYISTGETGLYEKYGYRFWKTMKDVRGETLSAEDILDVIGFQEQYFMRELYTL